MARIDARAVGLLLLWLAAACGGSATPIDGCPPNTLEVSGACLVRCTSPDQCIAGETCGPQGVCVPGDRPDAGTPPDASADAGGRDAAPGDTGPGADAGPDASADAGTDGGPDPDAGAADAMPDAGPDSGVDQANVSTTMVDFGRQLIGSSESIRVTISNPSSVQVVVRLGTIVGAGAGVFSVDPPSGTVTLAPSDSTELRFTHAAAAPTGRVNATYRLDLCDAGCGLDIALTADAIDQAVSCTPTTLAFGLINAGACVRLDATCTNGSSYPTAITSWVMVGGSSPDFSIDPGPGFPINLLAGRAQALTVQYCPNADPNPDSGQVLVGVENPNPQRRSVLFDVSGRAGGQDIACTPANLDFELVGVGVRAERRVFCNNPGNVPLSITAVRADGPAAASITADVLDNGNPVVLPYSVPAGQRAELRVRHTATATGTRRAELVIASNDRDTPEVRIPIRSEAIDTTGCVLNVSPTSLAFGAVRLGSTARRFGTLTNSGTGRCAAALVGLQSQLTGGAASGFAVPTTTTSTIVGPRSSVELPVDFSPTAARNASDTLILQLSNPTTPLLNVALGGTGYDGALAIEPRDVDFGRVPIGCDTGIARPITLRNTGRTGALSVARIALRAGSSTALSVQAPATPLSIPAGGALSFDVSIQPTAAGSALGIVEVELTGGPTFFVGVGGIGATDATNVVAVDPQPERRLDVLFVVDDSSSMAEEQQRLAAIAGGLVDRADASRHDIQLGVITMDGRVPNVGRLSGMPAVLDRGVSDRRTALATRLAPGTTGPAAEQGLLAATTAVTDAALLSGANAGFLRPDGELILVVLSDADDESPMPVTSYLGQLRGRPTGAARVVVHAISGGSTGCLATNTNAAPTPRWSQAVTDTGGAQLSICEQDFAGLAGALADAVFGPARNEVQLGSPPTPGTLEVQVSGAVLPPGSAADPAYWVDYAGGRVVFPPARTPLAAASISVRYRAPCRRSATCPNGRPDADEQCDDGNTSDTDACPTTCSTAICGDGFVRATVEQCDDGNTIPDDGCDSACVIEGCGNGVIEPPEACDDGPRNSDTRVDACRTDCRRARCGDGVTDTGETCDDGNTNVHDACTNTCAAARCGDGLVQWGVEACDDGNQIDTDFCNRSCQWTAAGFTITASAGRPLVPADGQDTLSFAGSDDEGVAALNIGFPFSFLGTPATAVYISTNGWLSFVPNSNAVGNNSRVPNASAPNAFVAWWWDNLDLTQSSVPETTIASTRLDGASPNRVRTLSFVNVAAFGAGTSYYLLTAELRLYEGSNRIEIHYGRVQTIGATPNDFSATVGWEDLLGTNGVNLLDCGSSCRVANWPTDTVFTLSP